MGDGPHHEGELDVRPQLDQAELADLRERPVAARPGRRAREDRGVGLRVGDVQDGAVETHQAEPAVEGPGRLGPRQGMNDRLEEPADRGDAQALPGHAQAGPMRGRLAEAESAGVLEDLADGQLGQDPHGQDHPADDLMGQLATARIEPSRRPEGLADGLGGDNLFESRQAIQDPPRRIGWQGAMSSWHASLGLLVAWVLSKPKVTRGRDLRLFRRYWV